MSNNEYTNLIVEEVDSFESEKEGIVQGDTTHPSANSKNENKMGKVIPAGSNPSENSDDYKYKALLKVQCPKCGCYLGITEVIENIKKEEYDKPY